MKGWKRPQPVRHTSSSPVIRGAAPIWKLPDGQYVLLGQSGGWRWLECRAGVAQAAEVGRL